MKQKLMGIFWKNQVTTELPRSEQEIEEEIQEREKQNKIIREMRDNIINFLNLLCYDPLAFDESPSNIPSRFTCSLLKHTNTNPKSKQPQHSQSTKTIYFSNINPVTNYFYVTINSEKFKMDPEKARDFLTTFADTVLGPPEIPISPKFELNIERLNISSDQLKNGDPNSYSMFVERFMLCMLQSFCSTGNNFFVTREDLKGSMAVKIIAFFLKKQKSLFIDRYDNITKLPHNKQIFHTVLKASWYFGTQDVNEIYGISKNDLSDLFAALLKFRSAETIESLKKAFIANKELQDAIGSVQLSTAKSEKAGSAEECVVNIDNFCDKIYKSPAPGNTL